MPKENPEEFHIPVRHKTFKNSIPKKMSENKAEQNFPFF